jgi:hypothetical protein
MSVSEKPVSTRVKARGHAFPGHALERYRLRLNRGRVPALWSSMFLAEKLCPNFRIMLG